MTSAYQEFIKEHAKQSALRLVRGGGTGVETTAGSSQGAMKGMHVGYGYGSSKKSIKNRSKMSMTRSKRTISARGFGVPGTIMKPAVSKAALRRNINQSGSAKLVLDDNDHAAGLTGILVALVATTFNML